MLIKNHCLEVPQIRNIQGLNSLQIYKTLSTKHILVFKYRSLTLKISCLANYITPFALCTIDRNPTMSKHSSWYLNKKADTVMLSFVQWILLSESSILILFNYKWNNACNLTSLTSSKAAAGSPCKLFPSLSTSSNRNTGLLTPTVFSPLIILPGILPT